MLRLHRTFGVALVGAGLIAIPPLVPPSPGVQVRAVRLTSGDTADSPLGDGTAFILGGSGLETPGQTYANAIDAEYLPEIDYNVFTTELAAGNPVDAIGIPLAADLGILPLALIGAAL